MEGFTQLIFTFWRCSTVQFVYIQKKTTRTGSHSYWLRHVIGFICFLGVGARWFLSFFLSFFLFYSFIYFFFLGGGSYYESFAVQVTLLLGTIKWQYEEGLENKNTHTSELELGVVGFVCVCVCIVVPQFLNINKLVCFHFWFLQILAAKLYEPHHAVVHN